MRFFVISLLSIFFTYLNAEESSKIQVKVDNINISVPNSKILCTDKINAGKDILKELENISNLSVSANLKLALYYMGTNQEIFNKLGDDKRIPFNQEFGGFIADKKLFAPNTNHKDLKKAYNFISQAIRLESSKNLPDWSLLRDYSIVKAACRPFLLSACPAKFVWKPVEKFTLTLFALNDSYKSYEPIDVRAFVVFDGKKREIANWKTPKIEPNKNEKSSEFSFEISDLGKETKRFKLIVEAVEFPEYSSEYEFMYKQDFTFEYKPQ